MVIGVSGKIGSGKDTVGKIIQNLTNDHWEIKKYADKLKVITCLLLGCTRERLEDREFKEKELGEEWWYYTTGIDSSGIPSQMYTLDNFPFHPSKAILVKLTPRKILQLLGTECGREILHPNIWINSLFADYKGLPNWIITDMRFPNELSAVKDRKGITIRVNRGEGNTGDHPSETALDNAEFDYVIDNEGTMEELVEKVENILKKENFI
jgi:hypothetical protein